MKRRLRVYGTITVGMVIGGWYLVFGSFGSIGSGEIEYRMAQVTRGDLETTVSASGILSPVTTIEVGTQISGSIDSVFVDYNDIVKVGQLLAVLDTTLLRASVLDAEAGLERAEAELEQASSDLERNRSLYERGMIPESDFLTVQMTYKTRLANLKSAEAALTRANTNLGYAVIRSPIDGIVIGKSVESGQTVAASLATPTLFVIAQDLSQMEILTDVDESDIGEIKEGQLVRFEVATYMDREFEGSVKQIRLQPRTTQNVVTYTAVVEAANPDGLLLPGMTATVDFVTDQRTDVLLVPNKALRFQPSDELLEEFRQRREKVAASASDPVAGRPGLTGRGSGMPGGMRPDGSSSATISGGMVWYLDSIEQLDAGRLRTGLTDGINTELVMSRSVTEGMHLIVGSSDPGASTTNTKSIRPPGGMGGGMGGRPPRF